MNLNEPVDAVAAGGQDYLLLIFLNDLLITLFDDGRAERGFLSIGKPDLFQSIPNGRKGNAGKRGGDGRGDRGVNRRAALQEEFGVGKVVAYLVGVLRAGNKTFAAQDTFVGYDVRLIFGETDRLHLAVPYAFVAVFAI